jgi:BirA family biotin operon repressor/biotin-[acetyl-CoA-carboxylase] ligase
MNLELVRAQLPAWPIHWFPSLPSTMTAAADLAARDCPHGTVVGAEEQTAGVGRHGHAWHSPRGAGLYVSIVLRPAGEMPCLTLALGLAAADAIRRAADVPPDLRWPNDVLLGGRKACGVLAQLHGGAVVAGIGINVNQTEFPPDLAASATSLRRECGREISREELLVHLLEAVDRFTSLPRAEVLARFAQASSYVSGRRVVVEQPPAPLRGVTAGLDSQGFLRLREDNGRETLILAGGVRPDPEA